MRGAAIYWSAKKRLVLINAIPSKHGAKLQAGTVSLGAKAVIREHLCRQQSYCSIQLTCSLI